MEKEFTNGEMEEFSWAPMLTTENVELAATFGLTVELTMENGNQENNTEKDIILSLIITLIS